MRNGLGSGVVGVGGRRGFTLIELIVVIGVVAVLVGLVLTAVGGARGAGRGAACLSNLRSIGIITLSYADEHRGVGPALGQPYGEIPNWALVVQSAAGAEGTTGAELYRARSVLVCPESERAHGPGMQRTYGMNATGLAGQPGDRADYDAAGAGGGAGGAYVQVRLIERPSGVLMGVDTQPAAVGAGAGGAPPATRTASVLDLRQVEHVRTRLSLIHGGTGSGLGVTNAVRYDGSAAAQRVEIRAEGTIGSPEGWLNRLP